MFKVREDSNIKKSFIHNVKCPDCESLMVPRQSQYGYFWGCSKYPKCKGLRKVKDVEVCPKCGKKATIVDFQNNLWYIQTSKCESKKCDFEQEVHKLYIGETHRSSNDYNKHGWSDGDWQEYADYSGMDSSITWGGGD